MKQLPSPEFRKTYPRLTEPVEVTALGRVIGTYWPGAKVTIADLADAGDIQVDPWSKVPAPIKVPQAERDKILRRINTKSS